jgi:uncharacterized protein (DUF2147 family)
MKMLIAVAALLLASSAAQAQYTFQYGGRTIHVDPDRGTVSIPGVYDNTGKKSKRHSDQDSDRSRKQGPQQAKTDPQAPAPEASPAPAAAPAEQPPPAAVNAPPPLPPVPSTATATAQPDTITSTQVPAPPPAPQDQQDVAPVRPETPPVVATAPTAPPVQQAPAQPRDPNSPVGLWLTEEKEGKVRIEPCGANLCGYSVDAKSNANGEQVLINMKPAKEKWTGRIYDPKSGSTYDSTIALKGTETLRVQGCALGGMFCGGQTWSRLN